MTSRLPDCLTDGLLCRLWHLIDANRIDLQSLHSASADGKKNHSSLVLGTYVSGFPPSGGIYRCTEEKPIEFVAQSWGI